VTAIGVAVGVAALFLSVRYFSVDPMEYDMANVRNERRDSSAAGLLSHEVDAIVGRLGQDGMAVMTDRLDQVTPLETELQKRYDAAPADAKPFETMRDRVQKARKRGFVTDADWKELEPKIPVGKIATIGIAELPEQVAR